MQKLHRSGWLQSVSMPVTHQSTDPQAAWRDLRSSHARVSEALERALRERHGLSLIEFEVLQRLAELPDGECRMQELADEIHLSQSALSRLVGRLEAAGLAGREICEEDRRGIYACITKAGRTAQEKASPTHREVLTATLGD
jgi:DNA-binding MarR family transcriptional regulator